jgi:hypothetical protein
MKPSKESPQPSLTPFEKASESRMERNVLVVAYALTMRAIGESLRVSGTIDAQAVAVLLKVAQETEARLGISA